MRKHVDSLDVRILEGLGIYGPRNMSKLSRRIKLHQSTLRDRIKNLKSHFSFYLQANVYHTFIGLKKAFVFARATPGYEKLLWESMRANDYWLYLTACYGIPESIYGIYGIPIDYTKEFREFLEEMEKLRIARKIDLFWSTCLHTTNLTGEWYDCNSERWVFKWNEWIEEVEGQGTSLPHTLVEPKSYPQKADKIDIIILKELEKDAECKLTDIAKLLEVPPQTVQYHFKNHVIAKGLIEGYMVLFPHFGSVSDTYTFTFSFHNRKSMARFALSLLNKPFVQSMGKIFGKNALLVHLYIPREEFGGFTDSLSKLVRKGAIKFYDYVVEEPSRCQRQTISYEFFKDNSWVYDHKKHRKRIHKLRAQHSNQRV